MKALEDLKAAYAAATPGEVVLDGQMVVLKDNPEYVMCDCLDDDKTLEQEMADARLIALMHNTLPALIECAEALKALGNLSLPEDSGAYDDEDGLPSDDTKDDYFITYGQIRTARAALANLENMK